MKRALKRLKNVPPVVVVLGIALAIVGGLHLTRALGIREVDARVLEELEAKRREARASGERVEVARDPEDKPAFREAYRVQETTALAVGLGLVAVERRMATGAPMGTVGELVETARTRGMLPPGVGLTGAGVLATSYATLYVRYRPHPIGVEVVSIPRTSIAADGAPLLARVTAEDGAELFTLLRETTPVEVPRPFELRSVLEAARWKRESLKEGGPGAEGAQSLESLAKGEGQR